jgi:hypothetical protein
VANLLNQMPIIADTDFASFGAAQTLQTPAFGVRITKIALVVLAGGSSSAGNVTITEPKSGITLYPPQNVSASTPANTILFTDNLDNQELTWRDFAVTGLTVTGTALYLWYRL